MYSFVSKGEYVKKIHSSSLVLMSAVFFMTLLLGPVFCGWVCPLGAIQEWIGKLGKKIFKNKYNNFIPENIDFKLRYIRYIFVVLILYNTAKAGVLMFLNIDPYYALFNFWTGEVALWAIIVLLVVLVISLFIERPWCKYICPYGAVLGIFNTFRVFKIRRNENTCINCNSCSKNCPMNIKVSESTVVLNHQCISCLKCTSENYCPVEKTTIEYTPEDIRGSFTIKEVGIIFDIPETILVEAFGIPEEKDLNIFKSKDIEVLYEESGKGIGNGSLKVFVALYKGLTVTEVVK
ncbi:MAG: 4Fe-4S binding protein [Proteocatella sp.]